MSEEAVNQASGRARAVFVSDSPSQALPEAGHVLDFILSAVGAVAEELAPPTASIAVDTPAALERSVDRLREARRKNHVFKSRSNCQREKAGLS